MRVVTEMMYLGFESRVSTKSGASYLLAKFMETETSSIFEFYVKAEKVELITGLGKAQPFTPKKVSLAITSFQNKAMVDLVGIE
jgi:hypothetical protein